MSFGASHYPIAILLSRLIQEFGPGPAEFVQRRLGYRNIERGLNRLQPWIESGEGYCKIVTQITAAFPAFANEIELAIQATKAIKSAEWKAEWVKTCQSEERTFRSFVHVQGEQTVPSGICIFGMSGGHRRWTTIQIPEAIRNLPIEEQLAALPELMRSYLLEYNGACPFFGKVTGFRYVRLIDYFQFDRDATFIEHVQEPFRQAPVSVSFR